MIIFVVLMGGSETHTTTVVGRIVLTSFFSAIQMMMRLLGLHYSRWQLRTFSHAVSMHPLLYYHIVPIRRYVDDSHFQLGFHSLTHVHFITEHKEIKHFYFGPSENTNYFDTLMCQLCNCLVGYPLL